MQTYNLKYTTNDAFIAFIDQHQDIVNNNNVLVQLFSGVLDYGNLQSILTQIKQSLPKSTIIGATTDGEIFNDTVTTHSVIVSITVFHKSTLVMDCIGDIDDSYDAGINIGKKLQQPNSKVFILFGDGLNNNGEEFLNGLNEQLDQNIVIAGGLSGDNATFSGTYLFYDDKILQNAVVGVSINSDQLSVYNNYSFAWQNIGKTFTVTKSVKNIVYAIDDMTPVELYKKYLGDEVAKLLPGIGIEFPLIIQDDGIDIARAVLAKSEDGSLIFAGNIQEGAKVRFGVGNANIIFKDGKKLFDKTASNSCEAIFIYSCMARRRFLDSQASLDIQHFSQIAPVSGFFTYGEFLTLNNQYKFLNESLTILALSENEQEAKNDLTLHNEDINSSEMTTLRALSHLVNVTSKELELLNSNLEIKVQEEIEKNHEYEKKVFDSMKMASLGDMIANIAHQWRQPLSVITSCASGLQLSKEGDMLDDDVFDKYMDTIIAQSNYLSDTINIFRDFIQEEHVFSEVVLQTEITHALQILDAVIKDNDIKLIDNIDYNDSINIRLVTGELPQVIINIINNAKDALNENKIEHKTIILNLTKQNNMAIITIEDNAGGIPEHILPKIFEPYFTTKHKSTGTGIGLYMSYDIITKHFNGKLYAQNSEQGAKFFIELPL